jgi:hypothetical protein
MGMGGLSGGAGGGVGALCLRREIALLNIWIEGGNWMSWMRVKFL